MPLSGDGVLLEQGGDPVLTLGLSFAGRLPLNLLQDELLVGGLGLVLVVDGPGHVLPQSAGTKRRLSLLSLFRTFPQCGYVSTSSVLFRIVKDLLILHLSDSRSPCSSGGTVQRVSRLCLRSGVGFQKVSTVPVFLSLMKISLSCLGESQKALLT